MDEVKALEKKVVQVGHFAEDRSADGTMTMASLGMLMEKGDKVSGGNIPPRPFHESTQMKTLPEVGKKMDKVVDTVMKGKNPDKAIKALGSYYERAMQDTIENFSSPANSKVTVKLKGRNDPLVDRGKFKRDVKYKIRKS